MGSLEALDRELGRVHAREFARLLCRATLLRLGTRAGLPARLRALGLEDDVQRWRTAARRARDLAALDGYEPSGLLRHALAHAPADWAPAAALVAEALALDATEDVRWHAAALAVFEKRSGARMRLVELAGRAVADPWRARARILLEQEESSSW